MTLCVIHQPEYFPWLGFIDKARRADVLVFLDHVQFDRSSMQNRTRIIGANGPFWLTIPFVHKFPQRIDEVTIADQRYRKKHWKSIEGAYRRAAGFADLRDRVQAIYQTDSNRLVDIALASVDALLDGFAAKPPKVLRSSELQVSETKGELVLEICRAVGATQYLAGRTGATYLDNARFESEGVEVLVQNYTMSNYPRSTPLEDEWKVGLSALDAWAHLGDKAPKLFRVEAEEEVAP